jgi:hypothetical protein
MIQTADLEKAIIRTNDKIAIEAKILDDNLWPVGLELTFPDDCPGNSAYLEMAEFLSNSFSIKVICECNSTMIDGINDADPYYGLLVIDGKWLFVSTINCQFMDADVGENNPLVVLGEISKEGVLNKKYCRDDFS